MAQVKCPKCGSVKTQLTSNKSHHGILWIILFGFWYIFWISIKWCIGLMILTCYDWWMAIIKKNQGRGHIYQSKRWFEMRTREYYCHDCGNNFRG